MICILAKDRKPKYYEQLNKVLKHGLSKLTENVNCLGPDYDYYKYEYTYRANNCSNCEYSAICADVSRAIIFIETEQLRAELKAQKKLHK